MHLFNSSSPQLEFASLTLLYNFNNGNTLTQSSTTTTNNDDDTTSTNNIDYNDHSNGISHDRSPTKVVRDTFHHVTSVTSPLATTSPMMINHALSELHESLSLRNSNASNNNSNNNRRNGNEEKKDSKSTNIKTEDINDTENHNRNKIDNDHLNPTISDNKDTTASSSMSMSRFQSLCLQEEQSFFTSTNTNTDTNNTNPNNHNNTATIGTGSKNIHGLTIHYKIISNPQIIQHCLSHIIHPYDSSNDDTMKLKNNTNDDDDVDNNMVVVLCIGMTGNMTSFQSMHYSNYDLICKMNQLEESICLIVSKSSKTVTTTTNTNSTTKSTEQQKRENQHQRHTSYEIDLILMSILLDDESLQTNHDIEISKKSNLYSVYQQMIQHHPNSQHLQSVLRPNKYHSANTFKPSIPKFKLKKTFKQRRRNIKKFFTNSTTNNNNNNNNNTTDDNEDNDLSDFAATAFLSQSTPSSEMTRIISDQMQVLSLAEKNMNLMSYCGSSSCSGATTSRSGGGGLKSPSKQRRGRKKYIGSDLAGFDYNNDMNRSSMNNGMNHSSDPQDSSSIVSSSNSSIGIGSSRRRGLQPQNSIGSEIASTTTTTTATSSTSLSSSSSNNIHTVPSASSTLSDNASVTSSSSTSSSIIPTLSGPLRDSSLFKKKVRRDKVRKAFEANNQSKSMNYAISMENGGMGQSPQRNKVFYHSSSNGQNASNSSFHGRSNSGGTSDFDPFAMDEENEASLPNEQRPEFDSNIASTSSTSMRHTLVNGNTSESAPSTSTSLQTPPPPPPLPNNNTTTTTTPNRSTYIPGSRKLFANIALNEDLSCLYRESKLSSYSVEGNVQILLKSDSTAFVPFKVVLTDIHDMIELLNENSKYTNIVSKEEFNNGSSVEQDGGSLGTQFKFLVNMPKYDHFFEILKYKCKPTLIPVPLVSAWFC